MQQKSNDMNLSPIEQVNKKSDSLLKMFNSEYFTDEMLIQYYFKYFDTPGTHDYLTNKLYEMNSQKLIIYAPYLCHMLVKHESKQLEKFLVEICGKSFKMFLLIFWCVHAFSVLDRQNKNKKQRIDIIERRMEMSMVNKILMDTSDLQTQAEMLEKFSLKQYLSDYYNQVVRLVTQMFRFSLTLKQFPKEDARHHLRMFIQKINAWLKQLRKNYPYSRQFHGLELPLSQWRDQHPESCMVVSIYEHHYQCFPTKNRVPYMILLECIDEKDLITHQPLKTQEETNNQIDDLIQSSANDEKLETLMGEIVKDKQRGYHDALQKIMKYELKGKRQSYILQKMTQLVHEVKQDEERKEAKQKIFKKKNLSPNRRVGSWPKYEKEDSLQYYYKPKIRESEQKIIIPFSKTEEFHEQLIQQFPKKEFFLRTRLVSLYKNYHRLLDTPRSATIWSKHMEDYQEEARERSPYGHFPSYSLRSLVIKGGDDLRQELLVVHMMSEFQKIFENGQLNIQLRPYMITVTSANSGIVEYIPNTLSLDALKKRIGNGTKTLLQIYLEIFGKGFEEAQKNFIESLAGYSLFTYLMAVKDRHNGNILIDNNGRIIHIDFGFVLGSSPGNMNFETAPFKLTQEYVELMRGRDSDFFGYFRTLLIKGFFELKKYVNDMQYFLLIMKENTDLSCFRDFDLKIWRSRFMEGSTDKEIINNVDRLIYSSLYNWRTAQYDNFQKMTNGIVP